MIVVPTPPWYESTLFWGSASLAIAIILASVATSKADLRWLIFVAVPFLVLCVGAWTWAHVQQNRTRWTLTAASMLLISLSAYWFYSTLTPAETAEQQERATRLANIAGGVYVELAMTLGGLDVRDAEQRIAAHLSFPYGRYVDNRDKNRFSTGWNSTFSKLLFCDPQSGIGSGLLVKLSNNPKINFYISARVSNGICEMDGQFSTDVLTGYRYVNFEKLGYTLDLPNGGPYGFRVNLWNQPLRFLSNDTAPSWSAFFIDDGAEELHLGPICSPCRPASSETIGKLRDAYQHLPEHLTFKTDILGDGPRLVREYALGPNGAQIGNGEVSAKSGPDYFRFTWKRTSYREEKGAYTDQPWP